MWISKKWNLSFIIFVSFIYLSIFILFLHVTGVLAACTNMGRVAIWKSLPSAYNQRMDPEQRWKLQQAVQLDQKPRSIQVSL